MFAKHFLVCKNTKHWTCLQKGNRPAMLMLWTSMTYFSISKIAANHTTGRGIQAEIPTVIGSISIFLQPMLTTSLPGYSEAATGLLLIMPSGRGHSVNAVLPRGQLKIIGLESSSALGPFTFSAGAPDWILRGCHSYTEDKTDYVNVYLCHLVSVPISAALSFL